EPQSGKHRQRRVDVHFILNENAGQPGGHWLIETGRGCSRGIVVVEYIAQGYASEQVVVVDLLVPPELCEGHLLFRLEAYHAVVGVLQVGVRSEERRVGKECRSRWSRDR